MAISRSSSAIFLASFLALYFQRVQSDVYMGNPRGSNNRLNGSGQKRRNNNRLFDSQNNAKGGYNVGETLATRGRSGNQNLQYNMKYFMSGKRGKSLLVIEWTNQHGCGNQDLNCDIILQYKCQNNRYGLIRDADADTIRNGGTTSAPSYRKIRYPKKTFKDKDSLKKKYARYNYGLHEPWEWYDKCSRRKRNEGLFTADQKLKKRDSRSTRQNPQGTRSGYECPEERDYYPYWHPTDWKDIAVKANSDARCDFYKKNSFNTNQKSECLEFYKTRSNEKMSFKHYSEHNNENDCTNKGGKWVAFTNFLEKRPDYETQESCNKASTPDVPLVWGVPYVSEGTDGLEMDPVTSLPKLSCLVKLPEVDCQKANFSRVNHLGNAGNAEPMNYTWVLPYFPSQYEQRCVLRIRYNISTKDYDRDRTFSNQNGEKSPVKNDPEVKATKFDINLQLAVNTAQFGRTFQDRSHVFMLMPRKKGNIPDDVTLHNLNVRGKRGNIVQVYPAVEYDFVPNDLTVKKQDYVHFQWTGSNNNPNINAGEGRAGTDRSNIVELNEPGRNIQLSKQNKMIRDATIIWTADKDTQTHDDVEVSMATSGFYNRIKSGKPYGKRKYRKKFQNQLDKSSPSYEGVVLQMAKGKYYYMCTRNNNFSNRNQKAQLTVTA